LKLLRKFTNIDSRTIRVLVIKMLKPFSIVRNNISMLQFI